MLPASLRLGIVVCAGLILYCVQSRAQCMLANPSFEVGGTGGALFGGWNQFGDVGTVNDATHGSVAARITGPNSGSWDVAGVWQPLTISPGQHVRLRVDAWHKTVQQVVGGNAAIANIEWRDAADVLLSYESYNVVTASTPVDDVQQFEVVSAAAPTGASSARILLGALQSPIDPVPTVYFDHAEFDVLTTPSLDEVQWDDFPGGTSVSFAGRQWRVKGPGFFGPGPNNFSNASDAVWVDANGHLHLTVKQSGSVWYSTEVVLADALGYGDYRFTTRGDLDAIDPNAVLGVFLWQYGACYDPSYGWWNPYNEIDIEFSRWQNPANDPAQYVAQPFDWPGNISRFDYDWGVDEQTTHAIRWNADQVEFRSWRGGPLDELPANMIHSWTYNGAHIPRPEQPRVHLNLWLIGGSPPTIPQEVVFEDFRFEPEGAVVAVAPSAGQGSLLAAAYPNPFNPVTTIRFSLPTRGFGSIVVYDVRGRQIATLLSEVRDAGEFEVQWNGRNDNGERVASGVYLYQLVTGDVVESRKMVLVK